MKDYKIEDCVWFPELGLFTIQTKTANAPLVATGFIIKGKTRDAHFQHCENIHEPLDLLDKSGIKYNGAWVFSSDIEGTKYFAALWF